MSLVKGLLEDLSRTNAISVSVAGALTDTATVTAPTLLGALAGGRSGAIAGIYFDKMFDKNYTFAIHQLVVPVICL